MTSTAAANREKMAAGTPLTDDDRWPWLAALRQAMRDAARGSSRLLGAQTRLPGRTPTAGDVGFVDLVLGRDEVIRRVAARRGHFMGTSMVDSQFTALEPPGQDELDVVSVDGSGGDDLGLDRIERHWSTLPMAPRSRRSSVGGPKGVDLEQPAARSSMRSRPPTYSPAAHGESCSFRPTSPGCTRGPERSPACCSSGSAPRDARSRVLPALGTHAAHARPREANLLFGDRIPFDRIREHRWREGLYGSGRSASKRSPRSRADGWRIRSPSRSTSSSSTDWDLVVSVGQVVPHEVIGMANFTKNLVIGLGGADHDPPQPLPRCGLRHGDDHGPRS